MKLVSALSATLLLASCSVSHHNVFNDNRFHFVAPRSRAHIRVPVTLRWTMRDAARASSFAIFVDRSPVAPGQTLRAVADRDASCKRTPSCPDASYLADRQIYTTTGDSFVLDRVADFTDNREKQQLHEVTVVLLDATGRRIGESAWYLDFWLRRAGAA